MLMDVKMSTIVSRYFNVYEHDEFHECFKSDLSRWWMLKYQQFLVF